MEPWQTRASEFHPYLIATIDELPAALQAQVAGALQHGETLASGLFVPENYRAKSPDGAPETIPAQTLIFIGHGMWHFQEAAEGQPAPAPVYIDPANIRWIRSSHLLLYGRLEIASALAGEPVLLDIEFNAVGWRQKDHNWRNMVAETVGKPPLTADDLPAPTEHDRTLLQAAPEKFVEGLFRYGLYTGETLRGVVFHPAVWKQHLLAFDEQLAPDTLITLTDASVLLLTEEKALVRRSNDLGLLTTRIPLRAIAGMQVEQRGPVDDVVFALDRGGVADHYRVTLAHDAAEMWAGIWESRKDWRLGD